jgi:hypothetical protein
MVLVAQEKDLVCWVDKCTQIGALPRVSRTQESETYITDSQLLKDTMQLSTPLYTLQLQQCCNFVDHNELSLLKQPYYKSGQEVPNK